MIDRPQNIRVLINPKSGLGVSMRILLDTFQDVWDSGGRQVSYQFSKSAEDGRDKVRLAIRDGVDTIIVVGGDGMINSIGSELLGTETMLGVIPTGSGNGFARHFNIPLLPSEAVRKLIEGKPTAIDVGTANGHPFFVTCSMAWDAAIVKTFEKSPVRGVLPYIFAAAYELFDYRAENFQVKMDDRPEEVFPYPMLFTVANLTQFGGGARIAPQAKADDGFLWLIAALRADVPRLIPLLPKLWDGSIKDVPEIHTARFKHMVVTRESDLPIQVDGELLPSGPDVEIAIHPSKLRVLVP